MTVARVGDIDVWYEQFGSADLPTLVLVSSLGGQALTWDEEFCELLASRGFEVVRFDLRDSGLSTKMSDAAVPDFNAIAAGDFSSVAYTLSDLASDTAGLIRSIAVPPVHVVGFSLGAMIAQTLALEHAPLVRSMVSISSTPSFELVAREPSRVQTNLFDVRRSSSDRETAIEAAMTSRRMQASPGFPFDMVRARYRLERMFDRAWYPEGRLRQLAAVVASVDRAPFLGQVRVPTLVVHGDSDPLIDVSCGKATAEAIPGAEFLVVEGMGHDLPEPVWNRVADAIADNASRAD